MIPLHKYKGVYKLHIPHLRTKKDGSQRLVHHFHKNLGELKGSVRWEPSADRLVLSAWSKEERWFCYHIDGDPLNINLDNLTWKKPNGVAVKTQTEEPKKETVEVPLQGSIENVFKNVLTQYIDDISKVSEVYKKLRIYLSS